MMLDAIIALTKVFCGSLSPVAQGGGVKLKPHRHRTLADPGAAPILSGARRWLWTHHGLD